MSRYISEEIVFLKMVAEMNNLKITRLKDYRMVVSLNYYIEFKLNRELTKLGIRCQ
jgi:hypothetical protein